MGLGPAILRGADLHETRLVHENNVLDYFWPFLDLLDLKNGSGSKFRVYGWNREVCTTKLSPFHKKSVIQRVGGWRARRNLAQTENKTPKQNGFKPGRWVTLGLDPFAPGHNKTIKNGHLALV